MHVNWLHYNLIKTFYINLVKHIWRPNYAALDNGETFDEMCGRSRGMSMSYIILNSVRQHNYFITQGNYIGYMFRL